MFLKRLFVLLLSCSIFLFTGCDYQDKNLSVPVETTSVSYTASISSKEKELPESSSFSIQFIDVGQADAALIECDNKYMLIDGGNVADSDIIYSILKRNNITYLDIVVGTHAHEDHIGGLSGALQYAEAGTVLCPVKEYDSKAFKNFKKIAEEKSSEFIIPEIDSKYYLGSAEITILGVNSAEGTNNSSIVLMIKYGETSFLFTGDAEYEAEQEILSREPDLSCNVLKIGHHGSDTSTSYVWLNAIMPEYAIISVGEENSYGHPTEKVLSRLEDAEVQTYRTDVCGDIYVVSDGETIKISTEKDF